MVEVSEADVASAYDTSGRGGGHAAVRLTFDPAPGDHEDSFLTVQPPDEYRGSAGEYMSDVCAALFGGPEPEVRYLARTEAMDQAMRAAKESLPTARERFLAGDLPPHARLMVKYEITAAGGSEYPWAYVTSWKSPEKVLGSSAGDTLRDPVIRAGRPVVIDAASDRRLGGLDRWTGHHRRRADQRRGHSGWQGEGCRRRVGRRPARHPISRVITVRVWPDSVTQAGGLARLRSWR